MKGEEKETVLWGGSGGREKERLTGEDQHELHTNKSIDSHDRFRTLKLIESAGIWLKERRGRFRLMHRERLVAVLCGISRLSGLF